MLGTHCRVCLECIQFSWKNVFTFRGRMYLLFNGKNVFTFRGRMYSVFVEECIHFLWKNVFTFYGRMYSLFLEECIHFSTSYNITRSCLGFRKYRNKNENMLWNTCSYFREVYEKGYHSRFKTAEYYCWMRDQWQDRVKIIITMIINCNDNI